MYQHDYKALISALFLIFLDHFYLAFVRKVNFKEPYYFTFFIFSFTVLLKVLLYVVEAYATLKGIMLASELGATHVLIETDLKKLVQVVGNGDWSIYTIVFVINTSSFSSYSWSWIPRYVTV